MFQMSRFFFDGTGIGQLQVRAERVTAVRPRFATFSVAARGEGLQTREYASGVTSADPYELKLVELGTFPTAGSPSWLGGGRPRTDRRPLRPPGPLAVLRAC